MKEQQKGVHYFPGHMAKALKGLGALSSLCDIVVEILDARAPLSSRNPLLLEVSPQKPRLLLLNKDDLADPEITAKWLSYFRGQGLSAAAVSSVRKGLPNLISQALGPLEKAKREKEARYGMKRQPAKLAVFGIPNVGKSTFINSLAGRKSAKAENRPGVTRSQQWVKVGNFALLLDTPGILPMNYAKEETAIKLALVGSIKDEVLPNSELAKNLLDYLLADYPEALKARYDYKGEGDAFEHIARQRGLLVKGGEPDLDKAERLLLKEFRDGILGRLSLEAPDA